MTAPDDAGRAPRLPLRGFVTIPELAAARGVSRVAVHQAIRAGKLRAFRAPNGRTWLIHVADARAYLERPRRDVAA